VPDIGLGEIIVIVVIALLVFGPDRLPKVAADAARTLRQVRQMAASARKDLVDAAGLEDDAEMAQAVRDLRDLDPRRAMQGVLSDDPAAGAPTATAPTSNRVAPTGLPPAGPVPNGSAAPSSAATGRASAAHQVAGAGGGPGAGHVPGPTTGAGSQPVAPPVVAPAQADPDWT
jgi:sec-independent protein translocase protein TatB